MTQLDVYVKKYLENKKKFFFRCFSFYENMFLRGCPIMSHDTLKWSLRDYAFFKESHGILDWTHRALESKNGEILIVLKF